MAGKTKLELTWIGKDERPRLEPRILIEYPAFSYHAETRREGANFDNMLIHGDNLLALKALETDPDVRGKVKCIYIDPPYNTQDMLDMQYDDGIEHSVWLSQMRDRFSILRELLTPDGVLLCQLNDIEMHYAKVILDEIFGRANFLNHVCVKMKQTSGASGGGEDKRLKKNIEHILIYSKDRFGESGFKSFNDVFEEEDLFELIEQMKADGKSWKYTRILKGLGQKKFFGTIKDGSGEDITIYQHEGVEIHTVSDVAKQEGISEEQCYVKYFEKIFRDTNAQSSIRTRVMEATAGNGDFFSIEYIPRSGRSKNKLTTLYYKGRNRDLLAWLRDVAVKKRDRLLKLEKTGTYWDGFPLNNLTKEGGVKFPNGKKPEALLKRVLELATNPGDLVLDSFAGSGTTGAVAHKMGRRWIMVELAEHAKTHIAPRMQKVINGSDKGGVTEILNWKGGGGYRFFKLAPSLLQKDKWGNLVINKDYNPEMLAEAICKHFNYTYAPSAEHYWMHGKATENAFIYVTTNSLSFDQLKALSDEVGEERSLLVCCMAYEAAGDNLTNLTIKKIPRVVLDRCEWGKDDYSLKIAALPLQEEEPEEAGVKPNKSKKIKASVAQASLFDGSEEN